MGQYEIGGKLVRRDDPQFDALIAAAHGKLPRPLCLCRSPGIPMYIAHAGDQHLLKRMPDSGSAHAPLCPSYEAPRELSGAGEVMGSAIQPDPASGTILLKVDFSLAAGAHQNRSGHQAASGPSAAIRSQGTRLGLRALLHYLWTEAGFHRWTPAMAGKRSWFVMRKYLMLASEDKRVRGAPLVDRLYIPEAYVHAERHCLAQRRRVVFSRAGQGRYLLLLGEAKEISSARFGKKLMIKHAPDCAFLLRVDMARQIEKRYAAELALWTACSDVRMVVIATFSVSKDGMATVEALALMLTTDQWIPIEDGSDKRLVDALTAAQRRFEKGLRYNLPHAQPLARAILLDTPAPVALYIADGDTSTGESTALDSLRQQSALDSWTWSPSDGEPPPLPVIG